MAAPRANLKRTNQQPSLFELATSPLRRRALLWSLARNDFRARFAGSLLGTTWAFAQPVLTLLLYLFIYRVGFSQSAPEGIPFVLWLIVGITPWFFFVEGMITTTSAFLDYGFLVKKVLFDVAIVPSIKLLASSFVHAIVFVLATLIVLSTSFPLRLSFLQVPYYFVALYLLIAGLALFTALLAPFFRDVVQIVGVGLQFLFWLTPVMWPLDKAPPAARLLLEGNPLYYVIDGLRDALFFGRPFWAHPIRTLVFWSVVLALHVGGLSLFRRVKPHLAEVL